MINRTVIFLAALWLASLTTLQAAESFIVENAKPRAEIVISATPTRMQRVAAHEFRMQIEKISGARLPIVTAPSGNAVKIFIGASTHNPVKADDLKYGAYRIATGADWMTLVGDDSEFTPMEPFAKNNGDIPRAQAEWEKIVGTPYGMPARGLYKNRLRLPGDIGKPDGAITKPKETLDIWGLDEHGSFNAVCGYLRKLGARWYLPGELGEVLPSMKTISLSQIDETVQPDFPLRQFNFRFSTAGPETSMWVMRLGLRNDERLQIAPNVTDFAIGFSKATKNRKADGFLTLAEMEMITDLQKAAALEQAALLAKANAEAIIEGIPVDSVKKTAQMQSLLARAKASDVIVQFADEDLTQWPFWKRGDGYHLRGRANYITKDGAKAEANLTQAMPWISEPRSRDSLLMTLAQNRERNLNNDDAALEAFNAIVADRERIGSADDYGALQGIARIQTRRGQYDEALRTLNRANLDKLQGTWRENILKSIDAVNEAKRQGAK